MFTICHLMTTFIDSTWARVRTTSFRVSSSDITLRILLDGGGVLLLRDTASSWWFVHSLHLGGMCRWRWRKRNETRREGGGMLRLEAIYVISPATIWITSVILERKFPVGNFAIFPVLCSPRRTIVKWSSKRLILLILSFHSLRFHLTSSSMPFWTCTNIRRLLTLMTSEWTGLSSLEEEQLRAYD